ncbi:hypothetical protein AK812_SmicGene10724 [Symbiodinium microadriaticum]|uniref:Uncharacterized protein n=1 Tax=Symbiodinium microadriaticum TaxID=2951 RepID=A0A1Q9EEY2_SYMMI|nr:hypothetical protein AK812_SmicGene10724 [Symbiodinium microadriaticum]
MAECSFARLANRTQACKTQGLTRPAPSADGSQPYREGPGKGQVNLSKETATKRLLHPPSDVINGDVLNSMPVIHIVEHDSAAAWHRHCSACWPTFVCKRGASGIVSILLPPVAFSWCRSAYAVG